jgi:hypothetical protein
MPVSQAGQFRPAPNQSLLAYVADLNVEVDRLRRHHGHIQQEARAAVDRIQRLSLAGRERDVGGEG